MANEGGGGKLKNKRLHGTKPYARPKSFLRRVTEAVNSFLIPSFFQLPESFRGDEEEVHEENEDRRTNFSRENLNRSALNGENIDLPPTSHYVLHSRTSNERTNSSGEPQMSSTLMSEHTSESSRFPSSLPNLESATLLNQSSGVGRLNNSISSYSSTRIESSIEAKSNSLLQQKDGLADNHSECSDNSVSTSGCSSMIPHPNKQEYQKDVLSGTDSAFHINSQRYQCGIPTARPPLHSIDSSILGRNASNAQEIDTCVEDRTLGSGSSKLARSLWTEAKVPHSLPQPRANGKKPSFNVSALGSPAWSEKSVLNDSNTNSSFYPGKTVYGGASSYQKACIHASSPYMSPQLAARQKVKVKAARSEGNNIDAMSSTARKILESIEKMSTPLRDAKRIPSNNSYMDSPLSFALPSVKRNTNVSNSKSSVPETSSGPPVSKLLTPSATSVARTFHSAQHTDLNNSRGVPDRPQSSGFTTSQSVTLETSSDDKKSKGGGKITTHRGEALHYSSKSREIIGEVVELPSVPLPITNLPTFNFVVTNDLPKPTKLNSSNSNTEYTFSSPLTEKTVPPREQFIDRGASGDKDTTGGFVFSQPLNTVINNNVVSTQGSTFLFNGAINTSSSSSHSPLNFQMPSTASKLQLKVKANASEEESQPTEGISVASHLKIGRSVMDVLGNSTASSDDKSITSVTGFGQKFAPPPGSWSCTTCLINNKADNEKCAACETPKPGCIQSQEKQDIKPMNDNGNFAEKFKPPPGSWSCPTCMINNNEDAKKCVACETLKPGVSLVPASVNIDNTWGEQFKPPAGSWQCDTCYVQNSVSATKCVSCDSKKAGTISTSAASGFKFGISTSSDSVFKMPSAPPAPLPLAKSTSSTIPAFVFGEQKSTTVQASTTFKFVFGNVSTTSSSSAVVSSSSTAVSSSSTVASLSTETSVTTSTKTMPTFSLFNSTASQDIQSLPISEAPAVVPSLGSDTKNTPAIEKKADLESASEQEVPSSIKPPSSSEFSFALSVPSSDVSFAGINANKAAKSEQLPSGTGGFQFPKFENSGLFGKIESTSSSGNSSGGFSFGLKHPEPVTTNVPSQELPSKSGSFPFTIQVPKTMQSTEAETKNSQPISNKPGGFLFDLGKQTAAKHSLDDKDEHEPLFKMMKPSEPSSQSLPNKTLNEPIPNSTLPSSSPFSFSIPSPSSNVNATTSSAVTTAPSLLPQLWGTAKVTETSATTNSVSLPSVFGGMSSTTTVSSLFGGIASNTKTAGEGTSSTTTTTTAAATTTTTTTTTVTTTVGNTAIFNTGLNSPMVLSPTAVTTTPLLFGMNVTLTTAASLQSASTATTSLPAFGTFQIPLSTSASSVTTTSAPVFGSGTGFNFNASTNPLQGFGNPFGNRISPPTTTSASLSLFGVNTTTGFSAPSNTSNLFTFGSQNNNPSSTPIGSGNIAFGAPVSTAAATNLSFGSPSTFGNPTQPQASFGNFASNNAATVANNQNPPPFGNSSGFNFSATPSFQFSSQPNAAGVFTFTGNQGNASQQEPSASLFTFGQQPSQTTQQTPQQQPSQPAAAQNFQFAPSSGFNFTSPGGNNSSQFPFSVNPPTPANPFDPSSSNTTSQTSGRSIRRAVRRTRR